MKTNLTSCYLHPPTFWYSPSSRGKEEDNQPTQLYSILKSQSKIDKIYCINSFQPQRVIGFDNVSGEKSAFTTGCLSVSVLHYTLTASPNAFFSAIWNSQWVPKNWLVCVSKNLQEFFEMCLLTGRVNLSIIDLLGTSLKLKILGENNYDFSIHAYKVS